MIEFVNCLFAREMGPEYEPLEAHRPRLGQEPNVEFMWAIEPEDGKPDTGWHFPGPQAKGVDSAISRPSLEAQGRAAPNDDAEPDGSPVERNRRREARWIARRLRGDAR